MTRNQLSCATSREKHRRLMMASSTFSFKMKLFKKIRGIPVFYDIPCYFKEAVEGVNDFLPRDGDIVINSYPKTGTNWLAYTVWQILHEGKFIQDFNLFDVAPSLDTDIPTNGTLTPPPPVICRTHLPYNWAKRNEKAKYLYIYRKPEDVILSYYRYIKSAYGKPIDFEGFFEDFLEGNVPFGSYFEHLLPFLLHKNDENLIITTYEKLHSDMEGEVLRLAKFLGDEFFRVVSSDGDVFRKIIGNTHFGTMKRYLYLQRPGEEKKLDLFKNGVVGDGSRVLDPDQKERLRKAVKEVLGGTQVINEWF